MSVSVFELFKIGLGPSSSHTVGPMKAARRFLEEVEPLDRVTRVTVELFGSLALTGAGHATDTAILLGLAGERPEDADPKTIPALLVGIRERARIALLGVHEIAFNEADDLHFKMGEILPFHTNGMRFTAFGIGGAVLSSDEFYSVGGGFIVSAAESEGAVTAPTEQAKLDIPYDFRSADELLAMGKRDGATIAEMVMANEKCLRGESEIRAGIMRLWGVMNDCIERGCETGGSLPGRLRVRRRAKELKERLLEEARRNARGPNEAMDWVSLFAIAVNEENAMGGRVVTAPTNGAAGIMPAVVRYYRDFCPDADEEGIVTFFLTAAAIGSLLKRNASISGAEMGCQGEVGSASAMAAAGLAAALGGSNEQAENAAEIGVEHHLGMTCDPVGGLVQIPCIERNAMGAVKAITAASLALKGDGTHYVSLDNAIETMRQTGLDMKSKYKETSQGGLAVNVPEC
ncbi:MAG: L-serine ammonia-lyase [Alphaproteobacteria bacterium]